MNVCTIAHLVLKAGTEERYSQTFSIETLIFTLLMLFLLKIMEISYCTKNWHYYAREDILLRKSL